MSAHPEDVVTTRDRPVRRSDPDVTVMLPVYVGTPAAQLDLALRSIEDQTLQPVSVLVIVDGDLAAAQRTVLADARARLPSLRVLEPGKVGLTGALNSGLAAAGTTWVARMDADDVAEPERLARQMAVARSGEYDVIGSALREFEDDPLRPGRLRAVPESHEAIVAALPRLNPINHPTALLRRSAVLGAGGYPTLEGMEDYLLWARMAVKGARFHNVPDALVRYRVDDSSLRRRASRDAIRAEWTLQRELAALGLVSLPRRVANLLTRVGFRMLPPPLMRLAYRLVRAMLAGGRHAGR